MTEEQQQTEGTTPPPAEGQQANGKAARAPKRPKIHVLVYTNPDDGFTKSKEFETKAAMLIEINSIGLANVVGAYEGYKLEFQQAVVLA